MFAPGLEKEAYLVREVLEGAVAPHVAAELLREALEAVGTMPASVQQVLAFCRGPLGERLEQRAGRSVLDSVLGRLESMLVDPQATTPGVVEAEPFDARRTDVPLEAELSFDIDLDVEDEGRAERSVDTLTMATETTGPVRVLVVSTSGSVSDQLLGYLGRDRIAPSTVDGSDGPVLKTVFSLSPLLVIVDGTAPALGEDVVIELFRSLPYAAHPVVWGVETAYGKRLSSAMGKARVEANTLPSDEGFDALVDLILVRQQS